MNRGSRDSRACAVAAMPGFNEAPIHESGKSCKTRSDSWRGIGFNEAPIHESGKCAAPTVTVSPTSGFNEAPIHESGKFRPPKPKALLI